MSAQKTILKRQAYTFMDLLGDFGGFNDALFFFGTLLFTAYSSKMFMASIATELPSHQSNQLRSATKAKIKKLYRDVSVDSSLIKNF